MVDKLHTQPLATALNGAGRELRGKMVGVI
jgi:hypothetical protein